MDGLAIDYLYLYVMSRVDCSNEKVKQRIHTLGVHTN